MIFRTCATRGFIRRTPLARSPLVCAVVIGTGLIGAGLDVARADWPDDPTINVPVSVASGAKSDVFAVSDGAGGVIITWEDERTGGRDIYSQRIDIAGDVLWQTDGVPICTAPGDQHLYHSSTSTTGFTPLIPDGQGGAFIVWHDARAFSVRLRDVYCQRIDADGQVQFAENGMALADSTGTEDQPTMCSDGEGGAIVVWQDKNDDPIHYNLYGQRIDAAGTLLWNGGSPQPIVVIDWSQTGPTLCPDGAGGAFVAWSDSRTNLNDVYAQHLADDGSSLWPANGVMVATSAQSQDAVTITLAEDGHPLLAWVDRRTTEPDIYAQKLDATSGAALWLIGGRVVCDAAESQYRPALTTDGASGAIVTWYDFRDASGPPFDLNIYAQRIVSAGTAAWTPNGVIVCAAADAQRDPNLASDGQGGALIAWEDNRIGDGREDIYAQHIDGDGTPLLATDGVAVCTAEGNQVRPAVVAGAGGMIAAWPDDRDVLWEPDVYADRVVTDVTAVPDESDTSDTSDPSGMPAPARARLTCHPNPFNPRVQIAFTTPGTGPVTLRIYDLSGRSQRTLIAAAHRQEGEQTTQWDGHDSHGHPLPAGVYLLRLVAGDETVTRRITLVR
jgi:hypothetical protein